MVLEAGLQNQWMKHMETNVSYTVAGIFVIGLTALIILGVIWLSAGFSREETTIYKVLMKESVSGLSLDAPVEFNGVNVGTVAKMKITKDNPELVELLLKIQQDTPVSNGTRAKLGMRALTGVAYILLEDKGNDKTPLIVKNGELYPVIQTEPSILVRLDTTLTEIKDSFSQVSRSVKSLLNDKNLKSIKGLLESGQQSFYLIKTETIPATNQAITNFGNLTEDLSDFANEIKQNPSILIRGKDTEVQKGPGE